MSQVVKSKGLLSILVLGSGNVVGTIVSAIALILFSRYMGPTEFGLFSAAFAAMQITVRLSDLGTNMAVERAVARVHDVKGDLADRLMRVAFWFKLVSFTLAMIIAWSLAPWISHILLKIEDLVLIRLAFALSFGTVFFEYSTAVFQSTHRFAMVARITIAQALGKLLFGLILIWQGMLHATSAVFIYGLLPGLGALMGWSRRILSSLTLPLVALAALAGFAQDKPAVDPKVAEANKAIISAEIAAAAAEGATGMKAMGKVVSAVRAKAGPTADGAKIAAMVKAALAG